MALNVALKFAPLPPSKKNTGRPADPHWAAVAAALKERPGEWACVKFNTRDSSFTHRITGQSTQHHLLAFRDGVYEAVSRNGRLDKSGRRVADIWARYMGPKA